MNDSAQLSRVRARFTRTAEQFGRFSLSTRNEEAARLVELLLADFPSAETSTVLDVACGPGTFALALAPRVACAFGLDFTPALLERARGSASASGIVNSNFLIGDANAIPFSAGRFDLVTCAYALHHIDDPSNAVSEIVRVLRPGGRMGLIDIFVPENAVAAEAANTIERVRDTSHTRTLAISELRALAEAAGLRIVAAETSARSRSFDDWMLIAGHASDTPAYAEARRLLEGSIAEDAAGFQPRLATAEDVAANPPISKNPPVKPGDLLWTQSSFSLIAMKP